MNPNEKNGKDKPQRVTDPGVEIGINLNTIFTGLMLGVVSWVGFNIEKIKDNIGDVTTAVAVTQEETRALRRDVDRHENILFGNQKRKSDNGGD